MCIYITLTYYEAPDKYVKSFVPVLGLVKADNLMVKLAVRIYFL